MRQIYIVTGATGHLGTTIVKLLNENDCTVRGLALPGEKVKNSGNTEYFFGDVTKIESLEKIFCNAESAIVIHAAGMVDISGEISDKIYDTNVYGTKNIIQMCKKNNVKRLVYVSSVHAIPEKDGFCVLSEIDKFSADSVIGGYAKTKAEATQAVLDAAYDGLDAVVVHPSGILGPYDHEGNHLVQMVKDYIMGKLPACVKGGYDFVDVRDVAKGCIDAAEKGKSGNCYILSNRYYEVRDVLKIVRNVCGGKRLPVLPIWAARAAAPILVLDAKRKKKRPLYTKYSLYTLNSNSKFNHDKATAELGYKPRDLIETIKDTVAYIKGEYEPAL